MTITDKVNSATKGRRERDQVKKKRGNLLSSVISFTSGQKDPTTGGRPPKILEWWMQKVIFILREEKGHVLDGTNVEG